MSASAEQELFYAIALSKLESLGLSNITLLYRTMGSATAVFENKEQVISSVNNPKLADTLKNADFALRIAEKEMNYLQGKSIKCMTMNDDDYPYRLKVCEDAPVVLFFCGKADFNRKRVINMIGTRKCTPYGIDLCTSFVEGLREHDPDILIISGLAYGIDIHSHRAALANGMDTVGILAHGLDRIYPQAHRQTAVEMTRHGGLMTEFTSQTTPERINFVRRNRIVAGLCDACVVVESAAKGGSLITAKISNSYNRDVFAFPGRIKDEYSAGCNMLIKRQKAMMIESAEDFLSAMGWEEGTSANQPVQQELFVELSQDEQTIVDLLKAGECLQINKIVSDSALPYPTVSSILFGLEMKGMVCNMGGSKFRLKAGR